MTPFIGEQDKYAYLDLGKNEKFREDIIFAAERTGVKPEIIASVINAEAAKISVSKAEATETADKQLYEAHPELDGRALTKDDVELVSEWKGYYDSARSSSGTWDVNSKNNKSSAAGLTQFLKSTWIGEAERSGTYLNEIAKDRGYIDSKNKMVDSYKDKLLDMRFESKLAITAAAEYDKAIFDSLVSGGRVSQNLNDSETAKYLYIGHHEGLGGARAILPKSDQKSHTLTDERAKTLFGYNAGSITQAKYLKNNGNDYSNAYIKWLEDYTGKAVQPGRYTKGD